MFAMCVIVCFNVKLWIEQGTPLQHRSRKVHDVISHLQQQLVWNTGILVLTFVH